MLLVATNHHHCRRRGGDHGWLWILCCAILRVSNSRATNVLASSSRRWIMRSAAVKPSSELSILRRTTTSPLVGLLAKIRGGESEVNGADVNSISPTCAGFASLDAEHTDIKQCRGQPSQPVPLPNSTTTHRNTADESSLSQLLSITHRNDRPPRWTICLWCFPILSGIVSFATFGATSRWLFACVQWASAHTWIPPTDEGVTLQMNVVTQVVNGPVITSVSVLFASLVGLTISNLHARQAEIHMTLIMEVQYLRELQQLVLQSSNPQQDEDDATALLRNCLQQHTELLLSRPYATASDTIAADPHTYIESSLAPLLLLRSAPDVSDRIRAMLHQRSLRWLALHAAPFPLVHYGTLGVLMVAIVVSFLVATTTTVAPPLGLPVRVLWAVLWTSFTALGSVCYDLAQPFGGCYHIAA